jgi:hypothetical protein
MDANKTPQHPAVVDAAAEARRSERAAIVEWLTEEKPEIIHHAPGWVGHGQPMPEWQRSNTLSAWCGAARLIAAGAHIRDGGEHRGALEIVKTAATQARRRADMYQEAGSASSAARSWSLYSTLMDIAHDIESIYRSTP